MSEIKINTQSMRQYANRIAKVNTRVINLNRRINGLYNNVGLLGLFRIMQSNTLVGYNARLVSAKNYLYDTARDFELVESNLSNVDPINFNRLNATINDITNRVHDQEKSWKNFFKNVQKVYRAIGLSKAVGTSVSIWDKFWDGELEKKWGGTYRQKISKDEDDYWKLLIGTLTLSGTPKYGEYKNDDAFNEKIKEFLKNNTSHNLPEQTKKDGYQKNKDEKFYKKRGTILEAKGEVKAKGSVLEGKLAGDNGVAEGSIEGKLLTAEAHANAAAGLYVYEKDKDGNTKRIFSPGVTAEVGASVAAFEVKGEGRVGIGEDKKGLGLYGDVDVKAASAEAKGKIAINKNEVFAGASAEADLVKATATGGVSVLGADVGVTGSVKVGVGAHANIGYTDKKLKVDVGAAIGVGVDVGFEIDVGGTVDAVCGFGQSVFNDVKGFIGGLW